MHELKIADPDMWQEFVNSATLAQATLSLSLALVYIKQWSISTNVGLPKVKVESVE